MKTRTCLVCNSVIVGRSDKKYCSDQCRAVQNNSKKNASEEAVLRINRHLRKNRTILKRLCPAGRAIVPKHILQGIGYQFHIFNSIFVTKSKSVFYICYDIAFTPLREKGVEKTLIVQWKEYRSHWDPWIYLKNEKLQTDEDH